MANARVDGPPVGCPQEYVYTVPSICPLRNNLNRRFGEYIPYFVFAKSLSAVLHVFPCVTNE